MIAIQPPLLPRAMNQAFSSWRLDVAPTFAHCVWLSAPRGGCRHLGAALRRLVVAPTFAHCVWLSAPSGGCRHPGAALRRLVVAPTFAHCVWLSAPSGGCRHLGAALRRLVALLCALATVWPALAQDSRTVVEPSLPRQTCAVLMAAYPSPKTPDADDTLRLQNALDHCPAGQAVHLVIADARVAFVSGPLTLPSGVTLVVNQGATLYAGTNPRWFDTGTGQCGRIDSSGKGCKPLISVVDGAQHSAVMGAGTIDGQGGERMDGQQETWWELARRAQAENAHQNVPRLIVSKGARDLTLYRITLRNSPNFHVLVQQADGFTAWGVTIDAPARARNTDGIDPVSSRNVTIAYSLLRTGDDSIAIKAGAAGPTENVSVLHNHFYNGHGMSIGSETNGGVHHVLVQDLSMEGSVSGLRIKSDVSRGGLVSDVLYQDICLQDVVRPIDFDTHYTAHATGGLIPQYVGITLQRVYSLTKGRVQLRGFDADHALVVRLDDVAVVGDPSMGESAAEFTQLNGVIARVVSDARKTACEARLLPFPKPPASNIP